MTKFGAMMLLPLTVAVAVAFSLAILVVAEVTEWQPKTRDEVKAIRVECLQQHPLSMESMESMKQLNFPNEPNVRKYLLCTALKMEIFNEQEGYNPNRIAQQFRSGIPEEEVLQIAITCADKNEQGSPADEWAFRGHQCVLNSRVGEMMRAFIKRKQEEAQRAAH